MIYFFWVFYFLLSLIISLSIRKLIKHSLLKKVIFSFVITISITIWYKFPGSKELSPIIPIILLEYIEFQHLNIARLLRPSISIFLIILILDILLNYLKKVRN